MWIDTHAHLAELSDEEYLSVLERARDAGINSVINIGTNIDESRTVIRQTTTKSPIPTHAVVGIAVPESDKVYHSDDWVQIIEDMAKNPAVVGIGEIGIDNTGKGNYPAKHIQVEIFEKHIGIAKRVGKPIIIHARDAEEEVLDILIKQGITQAVFHCFTGGANTAKRIADAGYFISFSGIATFKNGGLDEAIRAVPSNRILVETDSPYLAPVPHRGKKNEPAFVRHTGEKVANIRGVSPDEFAKQTTLNAQSFFKI